MWAWSHPKNYFYRATNALQAQKDLFHEISPMMIPLLPVEDDCIFNKGTWKWLFFVHHCDDFDDENETKNLWLHIHQDHCHTVISDLAQDLNIFLRILIRKLTAYYLNILKAIYPKIWIKVIQCILEGLWELSTNLRFSPSVQVFIPFLPSRLFQLENCLCRLTTLHSSLSTAIQTQP